jgi:hypothetical protein
MVQSGLRAVCSILNNFENSSVENEFAAQSARNGTAANCVLVYGGLEVSICMYICLRSAPLKFAKPLLGLTIRKLQIQSCSILNVAESIFE